jgi:hypothetical protein
LRSCIRQRRGCCVASRTRPTGGAFAVLTDEGRDVLRQMWPDYAAGIAEHFGRHVSDEEAYMLTEALSRVLAANR